MDLDEFQYRYFEEGYIVSQLPREMHPEFWAEIYTTNWIKSKYCFRGVPDWYVEGTAIDEYAPDRHQEKEYHANKQIMRQVPDSMRVLAEKVIQMPMFDNMRVSLPSSTIRYLHLWNGTEPGEFHQDFIDGSTMLILIYFSDVPKWDPEWGASITVQKKVKDKELYTKQVYPDSGNMVIINNTSPLFLHKVEELYKPELNRYTFAFNYDWDTWKDNGDC